MITAALFDYDGTLVNTDAIHFACWNKALKRYAASLDGSFYSKHCSGAVSLHIAKRIIEEMPQIPLSAKALAQEKDSYYENWITLEKVTVMPGVLEMLAFLRDMNIQLGIVTGAPFSAIQKTLHDNQIFDYFQVKVTRESVNRGKPAPDGYMLGLNRLKTEGRLSVSFEDTQSGVIAAKAAGMLSFAIPNTYTASHDLSLADHLCMDMFHAKDIILQILD
jgi:HAD superfamily hydrolase (TIGR01509 family)